MNRPRTSPVAWGAGACELSTRWLGGCHLVLTQVYTSHGGASANREKPRDFTKDPVIECGSRSFHAQTALIRPVAGAVPGVTHDTRMVVKTSKFASASSKLFPELGTRHHTGRKTDMARNTKVKLAALATTLVATLGVVAVAPSSGADAGRTPHTITKTGTACC
jgi:hypothetical protein